MAMPTRVIDALDAFVARYVAAWPRLSTPWDADWRSACELGPPGPDGRVPWAPLRHDFVDHFAGLENALETSVHPDIKAFFGHYWSGGLEAATVAPDGERGHVSLILLWNADDAERLIENQIGHVLNKRRARQPLSLFFACTEPESELILTLRNDTGQVQLENPGTRKLQVVAQDLATFIDHLQPAAPELNPEYNVDSHTESHS